VAIFRDEARYLAEWIEFQRAVGVEHVYLYDHGSEDDPRPVLEPFLAEGYVTLTPWSLPWHFGGTDAQTYAYAHALGSFGSHWRWMAFLDVDEFLFTADGSSLPTFLREYDDLPALLAFWTMFGFSGHDSAPEGLVIENYTMRAPFGLSAKPKSIVNPMEVVAVSNPHLFDLTTGTRRGFTERRELFSKVEGQKGKQNVGSPVSERLCLNHYYTKSRTEFEEKIRKRLASGRSADVKKLRGIAQELDRAAFRDDAIGRFGPGIRARLRHLPLEERT